ncbi:MAG: diaminopimelate decarboxylase, partial [Bacteroidaceae bacterium]|nr:diaminopimelate decarboxylase [Bacteroidaceae bacterium]
MSLPISRFQELETPFYYYDTALLDATLDAIKSEMQCHEGYHMHYAVKACARPEILRHICRAGFGADCVSGGEIQAALDAGFPASAIVFAGVGKADWEIELALQAGIQYFNVESIPELEVINQLAIQHGRKANICLRINPEVGAHTHDHIATGRAEDKFGIAMQDMVRVIRLAESMEGIRFAGLHFHIGSQLLVMDDFVALAHRINELQEELEAKGIGPVECINVGGGLGIDYHDPDSHPVPAFEAYFSTYATHLRLRPGQQLHFELGRAIVAQCGSLIARCLYVKQGTAKQFVILDAGMTDLIRPALYDAYHRVENLSSEGDQQLYDVVGPICESSDVFLRDHLMPLTRRGDLIAIRSTGAYGETMASQYNCRRLPKG